MVEPLEALKQAIHGIWETPLPALERPPRVPSSDISHVNGGKDKGTSSSLNVTKSPSEVQEIGESQQKKAADEIDNNNSISSASTMVETSGDVTRGQGMDEGNVLDGMSSSGSTTAHGRAIPPQNVEWEDSASLQGLKVFSSITRVGAGGSMQAKNIDVATTFFDEIVTENAQLKEKLLIQEARASHASDMDRFLSESNAIIIDLEEKNKQLQLENENVQQALQEEKDKQEERMMDLMEQNEWLLQEVSDLRLREKHIPLVQQPHGQLEVIAKKTTKVDTSEKRDEPLPPGEIENDGEVRSMVHRIEKDNADLKDRNTALEGVVQALRRESTRLEEERMLLSATSGGILSRLQESQDDARRSREQCSRLGANVHELENQLERVLESQSEALNELEEHNASLKSENHGLKERVESLTKQCDDQKETIDKSHEDSRKMLLSLKTERDENFRRKEEAAKLNMKLNEVKVQADMSKRQARKSYNDTKLSSRKMDAEKKELEQKNATLLREIKNLMGSMKQMEETITKSGNRRKQLTEERDEWKKRHEELARNSIKLETTMTTKQELIRKEDKTSIRKYMQHLREKDDRIQDMENERVKQDEVLEALFEKVAHYEEENATLAGELKEARVEMERLISVVEVASSSAKLAVQEKNNLLRETEGMEQALKTRIAYSSESIKLLAQERDEFREKLKQREKTLEKREEEAKRYSDRVRELNQQLEDCREKWESDEKGFQRMKVDFQEKLRKEKDDALSSYRAEMKSKLSTLEQRWKMSQEMRDLLKQANKKLEDRLAETKMQHKKTLTDLDCRKRENATLRSEASNLRVKLLGSLQEAARNTKQSEAAVMEQREKMALMENQYRGIIVALQRKAGASIMRKNEAERELRDRNAAIVHHITAKSARAGRMEVAELSCIRGAFSR